MLSRDMPNAARPRESGDTDKPSRLPLDSRLLGKKRWPVAVAVTCLPTAAHAHPGDHSHFDWSALAGHLLEPDHLIFIALMAIAGIFAFRARRGAKQRARQRSRR